VRGQQQQRREEENNLKESLKEDIQTRLLVATAFVSSYKII